MNNNLPPITRSRAAAFSAPSKSSKRQAAGSIFSDGDSPFLQTNDMPPMLTTPKVRTLRRRTGGPATPPSQLFPYSLHADNPFWDITKQTPTLKFQQLSPIDHHHHHQHNQSTQQPQNDGSMLLGSSFSFLKKDVSINLDPLDVTTLLRRLRDASVSLDLWKSAEIYAQILATSPGEVRDVYALAKIYFLKSEFYRCLHILQAYNILTSKPGKNLAIQCWTKLDKPHEALKLLDNSSPAPVLIDASSFKPIKDFFQFDVFEEEALNGYQRGVTLFKLNYTEQAKECFLNVLFCDPKQLESLIYLCENYLLSEDEANEILSSLVQDKQLPSDLSLLLRGVASSRLLMCYSGVDFHELIESVDQKFAIQDCAWVQLAQAFDYFWKCRYNQCLELTTTALQKDSLHPEILSLHITCLFELQKVADLYALSNKLSDHCIRNPVTWYAIGSFYRLVNRFGDARRCFSKALSLDGGGSSGLSVWLAFALSLAEDGDVDSAITAYSRASRLYPNSSFPLLHNGVLHAHLGNYEVAHTFIEQAFDNSPNDPYVLNEVGMMKFHQKSYAEAIDVFEKTLKFLQKLNIPQTHRLWESVWNNLAHVYFYQQKYDKCLFYLDECLQVGSGSNPQILLTWAYVHHLHGRLKDAIGGYFEAQKLLPNHAHLNQLLTRALAEHTSTSLPSDDLSSAVDLDQDQESMDIVLATRRRPIEQDDIFINVDASDDESMCIGSSP